MPNNGKSKSFSLLFIFGLVFALLFIAMYPRYAVQKDSRSEVITTKISVTHQFKSGLHTYVGVINAPTPCHSVSGEAVVKESYPEQVDIRIETKESEEICAQVVTTKKFKVSFSASESPVVRAFLNGAPILFEVTELPATNNLEKTSL